MTKQVHITLKELIRRKQQMLEAKQKPKTKQLSINSLDGIITVEGPTSALAKDSQELEDGDKFMVYQCVIEPNLKSKELQDAFDCVEPMEIVEKLFDPGEIPQISVECLRLSGYIDGVKAVEDIKN